MKALKSRTSSIWGPVLVICLTIAVSSAATATAAKLITGKQIKNNTITTSDIKDGTIRKSDLSKNFSVAGATGATGATGANGTARAYAQVNDSGPAFVAARTKGFTSVTRPATGVYCLKVDPSTGIDPTTTAAVATVEYGNTAAGTDSVQVRGANTSDCAADEFDVHTFDAAGTAANTVSFTLVSP